MPTRSNIEITETSVVSLNSPTATFTMPGMEIFNACVDDLATLRGSAGTEDIVTTLLAAAPQLHWTQTYSEDQVGAYYLRHYGYVDVAGPLCPLVLPGLRITIGYWGAGLTYPPHAHTPEELYVVLAGEARFVTDGQADAVLGPGCHRHHPSGVTHGMVLGAQPLLVLALWKGADLMAPSRLGAEENK